jgi:tetratricopeptide (TPR) repeat protein
MSKRGASRKASFSRTRIPVRRFLLAAWFLACACAALATADTTAGAAGTTSPDSLRNEARRITELIHACDFTGAWKAIDAFPAPRAAAALEETPAAMPADAASTSDGLYRSFLAAYLSFWRFLLTPEDAEVEESFKTAVRNALAAAAHDEAAGNPDAALFKACSYLFLSLSELESGGKVQAMYWLVRGIQEARKIAETYPNADPYLIVGCYDFYLSGEKADFRKMLGKAARDGFYFRDLASFIEGKLLQKRDSDWAASEALFRGLHTRYPANPLFSYHLAVSLRHLDRYRESLAMYDLTLQNAPKEPVPAELLCQAYFSKAQILEHFLKDDRAAIASYELALRYTDRLVKKTIRFIPLSLLHIGFCHERLGETEAAVRSFSAVSRNDDRTAWERAQEALARIRGGKK